MKGLEGAISITGIGILNLKPGNLLNEIHQQFIGNLAIVQATDPGVRHDAELLTGIAQLLGDLGEAAGGGGDHVRG